MNNAAPPSPSRIRTGIAGLDEVTGGGFLQSGVYILQGVPGAGKTIMANHIVHTHAAGGGRVVYVTLLAESHARLLQHMGSFAFFDEAVVPEQVYYVSAFSALRAEGLKGVVNLLRSEMRSRPAGMVVLDGLVMAASAAASEEDLKVFVAEIQAHAALTGCTTLLLTSEDADRPVSAEQTMVDGILLLRERAFGPRRERNVEVVKFRGSRTLRGNHAFQITDAGIVVYPRLESARRESAQDAVQPVGLSTGVGGLDAMFDIGGYPRGGITALSGSSGAGKTSLALHFLAHATAAEKGLFFGFYETPELLRRTAQMQGIADGGAFASGAVEFVWFPFGEHVLDGLAYRLLEQVERTRPARVVIDGMGGLMATPAFAERGGPFLASLASELRRLGTTTIVTVEQHDATRALVLDSASMSALADTVIDIELRQAEAVRRFVTIRKSRISRHDKRRRELTLTPAGLQLVEEDPPGA